MSFAATTGRPQVINRIWHHPNSTSASLERSGSEPINVNDEEEMGGANNDPNMGCCKTNSVCLKCKVCMDGLESDILSNTARLANLEQVTSGKIESAILMKNQIF